jgi:hypothetical protein
MDYRKFAVYGSLGVFVGTELLSRERLLHMHHELPMWPEPLWGQQSMYAGTSTGQWISPEK